MMFGLVYRSIEQHQAWVTPQRYWLATLSADDEAEAALRYAQATGDHAPVLAIPLRDGALS